ncbi:MAG: hypothetical protein O7E57_12385 [Gammaproteobacteria bacterium]|nr:hypothetical protein [Gammaproteobacteria bacterium]
MDEFLQVGLVRINRKRSGTGLYLIRLTRIAFSKGQCSRRVLHPDFIVFESGTAQARVEPESTEKLRGCGNLTWIE